MLGSVQHQCAILAAVAPKHLATRRCCSLCRRFTVLLLHTINRQTALLTSENTHIMSRRATNRRDRRRIKDARSGPAERLLAVSGGLLMVVAPPSSALDRDDAFRPSAPSDIIVEEI